MAKKGLGFSSRVYTKGVDSYIRAYGEQLTKRVEEAIIDVVKTVAAQVDEDFSSAEYDGTNDVKVSTEVMYHDNGLSTEIVASGNAVKFIEFGTGIHYADDHPKAAMLGMTRGEYGQGNGQYAAWFYKGEPGTNGIVVSKLRVNANRKYTKRSSAHKYVMTRGNPAAKILFNAAKTLREEWKSKKEELRR